MLGSDLTNNREHLVLWDADSLNCQQAGLNFLPVICRLGDSVRYLEDMGRLPGAAEPYRTRV